VFALETAVAGHHWDKVASRDREKTYNLFTWSGVLSEGPDLRGWLAALDPPAGAFDEIVLRQPSFSAGLASLLTGEHVPAWRDWLCWRVIHSAAGYLSEAFVQENFDFYGRILSGTPQLRERWKRGVSLVERAMGEAVGRAYVGRRFSPAARERMDVLVNEIVFPAAILQDPFFNPGRDDAANYGAIGAVIGHEIGHGFDDQGSKYDGDGRLADWWSSTDRQAFETRTRALIEQYNGLAPKQTPDQHVNGALTIGENIGDLGGLGIAWKAYLVSLHGEQAPVIDGLTGAQRFFLSWARAWQHKARDEEVIRLLAIDPHSPGEFRCNQIVRNLDEFYGAFDVGATDELWLDPATRVRIW
jgi:predicted metalloendopeptidase